jgi:hypothetical protein
MPTGLEEAAAAAGILGFVKDIFSPELIRALSPLEGLQVVPHVFQSVEQEGRWKDKDHFPNRELQYKEQQADKKPASMATKDPSGGTPQSMATRIKGKLSPTPALHSAPVLTIVIQSTLDPNSGASIEVQWLSDNLEIWAGSAGLTRAYGFGSVFLHQAGVTLSGVPYGNHFPASYFLSFAGYLNPTGPNFEEFRGALEVKADGTVAPVFCLKWSRDGKKPTKPNHNPAYGYLLRIDQIF